MGVFYIPAVVSGIWKTMNVGKDYIELSRKLLMRSRKSIGFRRFGHLEHDIYTFRWQNDHNKWFYTVR